MTLATDEELAAQHPSTLAFEVLAGVPDVLPNPYRHYKALRDKAPVHRMEMPGLGVLHVLTRYADCKAVLAAHDFGKGERFDDGPNPFVPEADQAELRQEFEQRMRPMLFLNPPDHTRIRSLVARGFTPRRIDALKPRIAQMVDDVLDGLGGGGEVELLDALAFPVPAAVIGLLVGVPPEDYDWARTRARDGAASLEFNADMEVITKAATAMGEMSDYFD